MRRICKQTIKDARQTADKDVHQPIAIVHLSDSYDPKIKENVSARIELKPLSKRNQYTTTGTLSTINNNMGGGRGWTRHKKIMVISFVLHSLTHVLNRITATGNKIR